MDDAQNIADALADTNLSAEEKVGLIYNCPNWNSYVDYKLRFREFVMSDDPDEDLNTLIQWYCDKKSKRVRYAGVKLRKCFETLPPVEQRKVAMVLLSGNKADSEWVCKRLDFIQPEHSREWIVRWHPTFSNLIVDAWKKYHGMRCGLIFTQFLDESVIREHLNDLLEYDSLYFRLCRRFAKASWFEIDAKRLKNLTAVNSYLFIMSLTDKGISDEEAELLLYQVIGVLVHQCKNGLHSYQKDVFCNSWTNTVRMLNARGLETTLYYLLKMDKVKVVYNFLQWCSHVDNEYSLFKYQNLRSDDSEVMIKIANRCFPDKYRYLTKLNCEEYYYVNRYGSILVEPRLIKLYDLHDGHKKPCASPYLYDDIYQATIQPSHAKHVKGQPVQRATREDYEYMLATNPKLRELVDKLELNPIFDSKS